MSAAEYPPDPVTDAAIETPLNWPNMNKLMAEVNGWPRDA